MCNNVMGNPIFQQKYVHEFNQEVKDLTEMNEQELQRLVRKEEIQDSRQCINKNVLPKYLTGLSPDETYMKLPTTGEKR